MRLELLLLGLGEGLPLRGYGYSDSLIRVYMSCARKRKRG